MSRGKKGFGVSLALFGLGIALFCGPAGAQLATSDLLGADNLAPAPVGEVAVMVDQSMPSVEVAWTLSPDDFVRQEPVTMDFTSGGVFVNVNDVAGYKVWRQKGTEDAEVLATLPSGATSYVDDSVMKGASYVYMVTAIDDAGLESPSVASELVTITRPSKKFKITLQAAQELINQILGDEAAKGKLMQDLQVVLANLMGIDPKRVVITQLGVGSLIVDFEILEDEEDPTAPTADEAWAILLQMLAETPEEFAAAVEEGTDLTDVGGATGVEVMPASIDLSGTAFNFAQVAVGETLDKTLTITNMGDQTLEGTLTLSGTGAAAFALSASGFALENAESVEVTISFTPADTIAYAASITVASNDAENPSLTVLLSGKGASEAPGLPGDFDGTGAVDFDDFFLFADHFGTTPDSENWEAIYDMDSSGAVDFDDFFLFADQFGKTAGN